MQSGFIVPRYEPEVFEAMRKSGRYGGGGCPERVPTTPNYEVTFNEVRLASRFGKADELEVLAEMYLASVSVRRVEDITEALWGTRVSPSTVSNLNQKIYAKIEAWRNRPIEGGIPISSSTGLS
jgi:hypothetical protein